ncbi:hypothetical protein ETD86_14255 [Nonomuraea turkmeniaca]|uniref:OmpA-like domain-containing protein n=1 Tax=Nonomuraea turkmeniaca TaxID=103838 RepID=A0A5S4FM28_9ACTN|nr:hypothetical protein [Nonomuraea turkmeniaca]TMR21705.1 hypothetical protein ETD86_14255 [Nonomuraea turkmeniaca]
MRQALSALVTRQDVRFQAKGYGSRRPLYSNDTDEGRRRNRRVSVTFAKPQAAASEQPATPTASEQPAAPTASEQPAAPTASRQPAAPTASAAPGATGLTATGRADGQPISMEVTGLRRLPGGLGLLTYRIKNEGSAETWFNELHHAQDWMSFKYQAATNVTLTDVAARRQYLPGRLQVPAEGGNVDAYCACSDLSGVRLGTEKFGPGAEKVFWNLFELPEGVAAMKVKIGTFRDLQVPVQ